jgi:hypothetical protein
MSYNSFAAPASPDDVFDAFERFGQTMGEIDITTAPINEELDNERLDALWEWENTRDELGEERCDLLCDWLEAQRAARRVTSPKAKVEVISELAPASPAENIAQPISRDDFLKAMFAHTTGPVYTCSFPNERDDPTQATERHIISRKPLQIERFISEWDKPGRGAFVCVGTLKGGAKRRCKENIEETVCLHADLDFAKIDLLPTDKAAAVAEVMRQLARLKHPPSITVSSGNGVHAYWLFKEPMQTQQH